MLAVIAPPTLLAGVIGGGLLGAFHHKGLGLKAADRERIAAQLSGGQAAVGVLVAPAMAIDVSAKLTELGGTAEVHEVADEAVAEVETAVPAVEAAELAAGDDLSILDGVGPKYADALKASGVTTFAQLSEMTPEAIEETLTKANTPLIAGHNAATWPRQAKLAATRNGRRCGGTSTPPRRWLPADPSCRHRGHKCIHDALDHPGRGRHDSAPDGADQQGDLAGEEPTKCLVQIHRRA